VAVLGSDKPLQTVTVRHTSHRNASCLLLLLLLLLVNHSGGHDLVVGAAHPHGCLPYHNAVAQHQCLTCLCLLLLLLLLLLVNQTDGHEPDECWQPH
jgi:hypothetical protein